MRETERQFELENNGKRDADSNGRGNEIQEENMRVDIREWQANVDDCIFYVASNGVYVCPGWACELTQRKHKGDGCVNT